MFVGWAWYYMYHHVNGAMAEGLTDHEAFDLFFVICNEYPVDCLLLLVAPPLSVDEVLQAVKGVNWRRLGKELIGERWRRPIRENPRTNLDRIHDEHESDEARLRAVVEEFLTGSHRPISWRSVIWALYCIDEIDKAQQILSYAEPLQGMLECDLQVLCTISRQWWRRTRLGK